jgi:hypothetical protein
MSGKGEAKRERKRHNISIVSPLNMKSGNRQRLMRERACHVNYM